MLWHLVDSGEIALQGEPSPRGNKELTCEHDFQMQTHRPRAHTLPSSMGSHSLGHCPPALLTQGRGPDNQGQTCAQSPLEPSKLATWPYPFLSEKTTVKAFAHVSPLSAS